MYHLQQLWLKGFLGPPQESFLNKIDLRAKSCNSTHFGGQICLDIVSQQEGRLSISKLILVKRETVT